MDRIYGKQQEWIVLKIKNKKEEENRTMKVYFSFEEKRFKFVYKKIKKEKTRAIIYAI